MLFSNITRRVKITHYIFLLACTKINVISTETYANTTYTQEDIEGRALPPIINNKTFWENVAESPEGITSSWMQGIACNVVHGPITEAESAEIYNSARFNNTDNKYSIALASHARELYDFKVFLEGLENCPNPSQHLFLQMGSLPLTSGQRQALHYYKQQLEHNPNDTNAQQAFMDLLQTMSKWSFKDVNEVLSIYEEAEEHYSLKSSPWIYWLSSIFDLRTITPPTISKKQMVRELAEDWLLPFLNNYYFHFTYTQTTLNDCINAFSNWLYQLTYSPQYEANARYLFYQTLDNLIPYNKQNETNQAFMTGLKLENYTNTGNYHADQMMGELFKYTARIKKVELHAKKMHSACKILKNWNARTFELVGSSDTNMYCHPIHGKLPRYRADSKRPNILKETYDLTDSMQRWDNAFFENTFPGHLFTERADELIESKNFEKINITDASALIVDFFPQYKAIFGNAEEKEYYKNIDPFTFDLTAQNIHDKTKIVTNSMTHSLSELTQGIVTLLGQLKQNNTYNFEPRTILYQSMYQILLAAVLTDNKFAQHILSYSLPIYTTNTLIDNSDDIELEHNVFGYLLSLIREILLDIATNEPEFVDFLTTYYEDIDENSIDIGTGHCRIASLTGQKEQDFSSSYIRKTSSMKELTDSSASKDTDDNLNWIKPFQTSSKFNFLMNQVFSINLLDLFNGHLPTTHEIQRTSKTIKENNKLNIWKTNHPGYRHFFPVINHNLTNRILNETYIGEYDLPHYQEACQSVDEVAKIYTNMALYQPDADQADKVIRAANYLFKTTGIPDYIKKRVADGLNLDVSAKCTHTMAQLLDESVMLVPRATEDGLIYIPTQNPYQTHQVTKTNTSQSNNINIHINEHEDCGPTMDDR